MSRIPVKNGKIEVEFCAPSATLSGGHPKVRIPGDEVHSTLLDMTDRYRRWNARRLDMLRNSQGDRAAALKATDADGVAVASYLREHLEMGPALVRGLAAALLVNVEMNVDQETSAQIMKAASSASPAWAASLLIRGLGGHLVDLQTTRSFLEEIASNNPSRRVRAYASIGAATLSRNADDPNAAEEFARELEQSYSDLPIVRDWLAANKPGCEEMQAE